MSHATHIRIPSAGPGTGSRRTHWRALACLTLVTTLGALAWAFVQRPHRASVRLFAYERTFATQAEAADFAAKATSTFAFTRLNAELPSEITAENFPNRCQVQADSGQPFIEVSAVASTAGNAREAVDAFARYVSTCADEWVEQRTTEVDRQIAAAQDRLQALRKEFGGFDDALLLGDLKSLRQTLTRDVREKTAAVGALQQQLSALNAEEKKTLATLAVEKPALRMMQQELEQALTRYTDAHPRVKELRAAIISLQKEALATLGGTNANTPTNALLAEVNARRTDVLTQLELATEAEARSRQSLERFAANEVAFVRFQSEYNALGSRRDELIQSRVLVGSKSLEKWRRSDRAEMSRVLVPAALWKSGAAGAGIGLALSSILICGRRARARVIRDEAGLEEVTGLPVLASLPHLGTMTEAERSYWAVETLQRLRFATGTPRHGALVIGIVSAEAGEGRSTWLDLFANAAMRHGQRVAVVSRRDAESSIAEPAMSPEANDWPNHSAALAHRSPAVESLNLGLQPHWAQAIRRWEAEENSVVLIELPAATTVDALLLASDVPHVLWLSATNSDARTARRCVDSLKSTGCNLIGAALNMSPTSPPKRRAALLALALALFTNSPLSAQNSPSAEAPSPNALSATAKPILLPWQQKLTLGPGDVFDVALYGQPDSSRAGITVGPDGRFSYLQALDVPVEGLTVDELRAKLEKILGQYHQEPRVIVTPVSFQSKKYYIFGNVQARGSFPLDKPVTIIEAVARARGFAGGASQGGGSFVQADLSQAFLVRRQPNGAFDREVVDFEALFQRGDLKQNKLLAPEDYLYFPPIGTEEVYVLGEVASRGPLPYSPKLTALGAVAGRGGFTDGAWRQKILVVRGSLQRPETFVVDIAAVLRAAAPDFELKPKDIVYVSRKPWAKAEELLKAASSDFVRAMVTTYVGREIEPVLGDRETP
jgi:protein involved in polysaccharide export with SLBB domain